MTVERVYEDLFYDKAESAVSKEVGHIGDLDQRHYRPLLTELIVVDLIASKGRTSLTLCA